MKPRTPVYINILVILIILFVIFYMFVQNGSFLSSPYFWGTVIIASILAFIQSSLGELVENAKFKELTEEEKQAYLELKKKPFFQRIYESAFKKQSAKEEKDLLIDHGFDGIMELDNQLPKWWLGLFWFGVAYLVIYMISYWLTDFAHPIKEYDDEYKAQIASIIDYEKTAPPITIETAKFSEENVAEGKVIFDGTCKTCHGDGGKGLSGPNLTDNYWINQPEKTLFKNIFHMVENGSPNNPAMQAWVKNGTISSREAEKVAAYVYHINQEQAPVLPAQGGAAPQGTEAHWEK